MVEMGGRRGVDACSFSEWVLSAPPEGLQTCRCPPLPHCNASERPMDLSAPTPHTCSYFLCSLESGFSHDATVHTLRKLGWPLKGTSQRLRFALCENG